MAKHRRKKPNWQIKGRQPKDKQFQEHLRLMLADGTVHGAGGNPISVNMLGSIKTRGSFTGQCFGQGAKARKGFWL